MGCFGALGTRKVLQTLVWQTGRWPTGQLLPAQFVTQTMVKGDRVTLMTTGGATVVTGVVESISLLYTTIRSDAFVPISIPNKVPLLEPRGPLAQPHACRRSYLCVRWCWTCSATNVMSYP